jgi:hypothetical protein
MEELRPLTISRSINNAPTVLLTADKTPFLLFTPLNEHILIQDALLSLICDHFKIRKLRTGYFTFRGKKYLCIEEVSGVVDFSFWQEHLWSDKRKFSQFLEPVNYFKIALIELFFPFFGEGLRKLIVPGVKNQAMIYPVSNSFKESITFAPTTLNKIGFNHPAMRRFFSWSKDDLKETIISFNMLNHDKFMMDLKYQLSLYPNWRNVYWNEIKKCSDKDFLNFTSSLIWDYFHRLGTK